VSPATFAKVVFGLFLGSLAAFPGAGEENSLEAGHTAYEASDYSRAVEILQSVAAQQPQSGEAQLLLAKSYLEMSQYDAAITSAERAVAIDQKNSKYHEWLGRAYGEKADHAGPFSGMSLARKTRKELATAVDLDNKNFSAFQALIEYDCSAPGIVGGGEDKARPEIAKLAALDEIEGHYATGNCRRQKKDFSVADAEFDKALAGHPKSVDLVYDIGDYAMKRGQAERLQAVADTGEKLAPADPRAKIYRSIALILKKENAARAEQLLKEYLQKAPKRSGYPSPSIAHEWMGRLLENQGQTAAASKEYEWAAKLDPKNKNAREALKRLGKN
jgi:tetratricopeptide (TPR) repeat protein